jgi:hypothetical protein
VASITRARHPPTGVVVIISSGSLVGQAMA